jgi:hypothetical protein
VNSAGPIAANIRKIMTDELGRSWKETVLFTENGITRVRKVGSLVLEGLNFKTLFDAIFRSLMFKDEHSEGVREQVLKGIIQIEVGGSNRELECFP